MLTGSQQHALFGAEAACETFVLDGAELAYWNEFLSAAEADTLFTTLSTTIGWEQQQIRMYGKRMNVPRLTAWYGDRDSHYRWSGIDNAPKPWTAELSQLREKIEAITGHRYNSVLLNLYRDGNDSVAWHADDESELGAQPVIASLSLGAPRSFQLRHRDNGQRFDIELAHGSLLLMAGATQANWLHQLPKCKTATHARINLTFRQVQQ